MKSTKLNYFVMLPVVAGVAACSATDHGTPSPAMITATAVASSGAGGSSSSSATADVGTGGFDSGVAVCSQDGLSTVDAHGTATACGSGEICHDAVCVNGCALASDSATTVGCDYLVPTPFFWKTARPPCFSVFVANAWHHEAAISVARDGVTYDVTSHARMPGPSSDPASWPTVPASGLPAGEVAVIFLSHDPQSYNVTDPLTCPVPPALSAMGGSAVADTGRGTAWSIHSDVPVTLYDVLPYGGATSFLPSAGLMLPISTWGTNYVAADPIDSAGVSWGQVVALEDGTEIDVVPSATLGSGDGVAAGPAQQLTSYTLSAGEYIQWQASADLSGSVIESNKPVAFFGGNTYLCYESLTSTGGGCDSAHQQIAPVRALADSYVAAPYRSRQADGSPESILYRIVGAVDGTTLSFDPPIAGTPNGIGAGGVVDFETTQAFVVSSQDSDHPFYVAQMMTGCIVTDKVDGSCPGDEEFVSLPPPAQFLKDYVFFTDPSFDTTNLVFIRSDPGSGFEDVTLDCYGTVDGWKSVGSHQISDVDLMRDGSPNGSCANGSQRAWSDAPFGILVWGTDHASSYAYPAGGGVAPINHVEIPAVPK